MNTYPIFYKSDVSSPKVMKAKLNMLSSNIDDLLERIHDLEHPELKEYLTFEAAEDNCIIYFKCNSTNTAYTKTIEVSTDCVTWNQFTSSNNYGTQLSTLNKGGKLYIRGFNYSYSTNTAGSNSFNFSNTCYVYGNIMSLIYGDAFYKKTELIPTTNDYCFYHLFNNNENLLFHPDKKLELPAKTLADYCYYGMFYGCISLETAPELPATTLARGCYFDMFQGCTNLTTAPELPATTLIRACYDSMFRDCTSLETAPELPATTLAEYCYEYMFSNCTSLENAPELPTTRLVQSCYRRMFRDCSNLNYIKCSATNISADSCTEQWVYGVAPTGTFVKHQDMEDWQIDSVDGIPSGWTVQNSNDVTLST